MSTERSDASAPRSPAEVSAWLNEQTGLIAWRELQRYFASGVTIAVEPPLNLLDVAVQMTRDDSEALQSLLVRGVVSRVSDEQARCWLEADAMVWSVVVAPWVLVQARADDMPGAIQ